MILNTLNKGNFFEFQNGEDGNCHRDDYSGTWIIIAKDEISMKILNLKSFEMWEPVLDSFNGRLGVNKMRLAAPLKFSGREPQRLFNLKKGDFFQYLTKDPKTWVVVSDLKDFYFVLCLNNLTYCGISSNTSGANQPIYRVNLKNTMEFTK